MSCGSTLPVGLDYDDGGHVIISADEAVREAISRACSAASTELGSARQVLLSPARGRAAAAPARHRAAGVTWAQASYPAVHDILTNPAYAGAFVFGRTRTEKRLDAGRNVITGSGGCPASSGRC